MEGFQQFAETVKDFTAEEMAPICGIDAEALRTVARKFARLLRHGWNQREHKDRQEGRNAGDDDFQG